MSRFEIGVSRLPQIAARVDESYFVEFSESSSRLSYFVFLGVDNFPHSRMHREALRADHKEYVAPRRQPLALAGRISNEENEQCGSFNIFEAANERAVEEWRKEEPYFKSGLVYKDVIIARAEVYFNRLQSRAWP